MRRFLAILLFIGGGIGAYFAIDAVLWQHRAIHDFKEVPADILSSSVKRHSGKHTTYSPEITYSYDYNGSHYTSTRVLPITESGESGWANQIVSGFPARAFRPEAIMHPMATAYVNPANPNESILVREYSFTPYMISIAAILLAEVGAGLAVGVLGGGITKMTALALDDSGWKLLLPKKNLRKEFYDSFAWLCGLVVAFAPPLLHWTFVAGQRHVGVMILQGGTAIILAGALILSLRRWGVSRHMSDVRLRVKPAPMLRGEPFAIELEADAFSPLGVTRTSCRIICTEHYREKRGNKTQYGTRIKGEKKIIPVQAVDIPAGQVLTGKGEVTFEAGDWPPATDRVVKVYPYYTWDIRVEVNLQKMIDYRAAFPLEVD